MNFQSVTSMAHRFAKCHVQSGDLCIDATVGNGYDTVLLASLVGDSGKVLGIDIQEQAVEKSRRRLEESRLDGKVILRKGDHKDLLLITNSLAWKRIRLAMFNLGYLPGGDKRVITTSGPTLSAMDACLEILDIDGALSVVAYRGHEGGKEEENLVHDWVNHLNSSHFKSVRFEKSFLSTSDSPVFYWIEHC